MKIVADVKCYHCGHISGQLEGETGCPLTKYEFRPRKGYTGRPPHGRIRCERCGGPVYLEDVRPVKEETLGEPQAPVRVVSHARRRAARQAS